MEKNHYSAGFALPYHASTAKAWKETGTYAGGMLMFLCMSGKAATQISSFHSHCKHKLQTETKTLDASSSAKQICKHCCIWLEELFPQRQCRYVKTNQ